MVSRSLRSVVALLVARDVRATFKGFVNPMRHMAPGLDGFLPLNLSDSESEEDLRKAIIDFNFNRDEYRDTVALLSRWRTGHEHCDTSLGTQDMWPHVERLRHAGFAPKARYVNVGANDGRSDDPLYEYARETGAVGVAIERDPELCERHRQNLPQVEVVCAEVTPQNVLSLVHAGMQPPIDVDVLKVDIDSYDCPVLEALLPTVSARFVLMEVNPSIPPPYRWAMLHHRDLWPFFNSHVTPEEVPIRGCSLSYEIDLLRRHGYDFIAFGGHDALFAHRSVRAAWLPLEPPMDEFDCYNEAFIAANGIPIGRTRRWFYGQNDTQAGLAEIWEFFVGWMQANRAPVVFPFSLRGF